MPSPVGHSIAAYAAIVGLDPASISSRHRHSIALGTAFVFGSLADADFLVAHYTTIPFMRHHYFTHSIPFAAALTLLIWFILKLCRFKRSGKTAIVLGSAYTTHLLLDYFAEDGSKPYGIPLLWPFTDHHFIAPVNIFHSIHRGEFSDLFSLHNLLAICVEIATMAPIALLMIVIARKKMLMEAGNSE